MKKSVLVLILLLASILSAETLSQTKKLLQREVYFDNLKTFYCNNPFSIDVVNNEFRASLIFNGKYKPRNKNKTPKIEWENIMPAEVFAKNLPCWQKGGKKACKNDGLFNIMQTDMHNLVPVISELNQDRANYSFSTEKPKIGQYGKCEFQVDSKGKKVLVRDEIKGDIARAYLYMSDKYKIELSLQEKKMFGSWNKQDPADSWEILKNDRVLQLQRNTNKFVE